MSLRWSIISKKSFMWRCQLHLMWRFEMLLFGRKITQQRYTQAQELWMRLSRPSLASTHRAWKIQILSAEGMNRLFQSARAAEANVPRESCSTGTVRCHVRESAADASHCSRVRVLTHSEYIQEGSTGTRAVTAGREDKQNRKKVSSLFYLVHGHSLCMGEYIHISNTYVCSLMIPQYIFYRNNANMF